jgi:hypothetical protein
LEHIKAMEKPDSTPQPDPAPADQPIPVQPGMFDDIAQSPDPPAETAQPSEDLPQLVFREHDEFGEWLDRDR